MTLPIIALLIGFCLGYLCCLLRQGRKENP